jgi:hypothetical protein
MDEADKRLKKWEEKQKAKLDALKGKTIKKVSIRFVGELYEAHDVLTIAFTDNTKITFRSNEPDIDYDTHIEY